MDILKIRKKRARERKAEVSAGADVADEPAEAAAGTEEPRVVEPEATASPAAASPVAASPAREPAAASPARVQAAEEDEGADDPLREFLARYDDKADEDDLLGQVETQKTEDVRRFLAFELAGEAYAANLRDVQEILRAVALTAVPRAPIQILGVLSKRGVVMPVVDLAATLGLREPDPRHHPKQRVLVVGESERVCGLRVDQVHEVIRLQEHEIEDVPSSLGTRLAHQLSGLGRLGDRMYILLDVQAVQHGLAVAAGIDSQEEL